MNSLLHPSERRSVAIWRRLRRFRQPLNLILILVVLPTVAMAQAGGSPFDTGFTALQTLFTGTVAKVASLIAIVVGGYEFAHGEPESPAQMNIFQPQPLNCVRGAQNCAQTSTPETSCEIAPTSPKTGGAIVLKTGAPPP